jgi:hypothetical protein
MTDPLSISASVAALIGLSQTIFQLLVRYSDDRLSHTTEFKEVARELKSLCGVLCLLQPVIKKLSSHNDPRASGISALQHKA